MYIITSPLVLDANASPPSSELPMQHARKPLGVNSLPTDYPLSTNEEPCDTEYYKLLQLGPQASGNEIKQQYYQLAVFYHPDNTLDVEDWKFAKVLFKAYHVLSNTTLRQQYNTFGLQMGPTPSAELLGIHDYFYQCLGGDLFVGFIGEPGISQRVHEMLITDTLASLKTKLVAHNNDQKHSGDQRAASFQAKSQLSKLQRAARKKQHGVRRLNFEATYRNRIAMHADTLLRKLVLFTDSARNTSAVDTFQKAMMAEACVLITRMNGAGLWTLIGRVYLTKARQFITNYEELDNSATTSTKEKLHHCVKYMYSLVESTSLCILFSLKCEAKNQHVRTNALRRLDNDFEWGLLDTLKDAALMDIELALEFACDDVLYAHNLTDTAALHRAQALEILGNVYMDTVSKANSAVQER
ncbi:DnaJ-like protein [Dimargaris verticillata]|uniref:DnaJ-like protein n=1 Tax=Dimargaris verticillata TaxID=2761393 RepID=A0A9W8AYU8_9FUNG|nr:DnaJ-like protein [Dimargaris verticillata]